MVRLRAMVTQAPQQGFEQRIEYYRHRVDTRLEQALASDGGVPERLADAMRYSVLGSGKRVRPLLSYASGELFGLPSERIDCIAIAVELVHAYSLIHDDLPAMDDDEVRRGRPTTHRKYGEAMAILAGDALQARAFQILSQDSVDSGAAQLRVIQWLARAAGPEGMVGGQVLDLEAEGERVDEPALADIHRRKTGELIRAAIMMPGELADSSPETTRLLDEFAGNIGLAFQIRDDLLEVDSDTATIGKSAGSDKRNEKSTYPSVVGTNGARQRADDVYRTAVKALAKLGEGAAGLHWIADFIINRAR